MESRKVEVTLTTLVVEKKVEKMLLLPNFLHLPKKTKVCTATHCFLVFFSGLITKMVITLLVASRAIDAIKIASLIS